MLKSILRAMLMVPLLVAISTSLRAQQTGSIVGTVVDKTGAILPNAKVMIHQPMGASMSKATKTSCIKSLLNR